MTKERSEEVLLIALALSVALHVLLMIYAKPRVMTHVAAGVERMNRRAPMKVVSEPLRDRAAVKIESLADVEAAKAAPDAKEDAHVSAPGLERTDGAKAALEALAAVSEVVDGVKPKAEEAHRFKEESLKLDDRGSAKVPVVEIETPSSLPALTAGGFARIAAPAAAPAAADEAENSENTTA